jgi:hypothetical protein
MEVVKDGRGAKTLQIANEEGDFWQKKIIERKTVTQFSCVTATPLHHTQCSPTNSLETEYSGSKMVGWRRK